MARFRLVGAIGLFHALARDIGRMRGCVGGDHSFVFPDRQVSFLQKIVHFAGREVRFLQNFGIGVRHLTYLLVSGCGVAIVFLITEEIAEIQRRKLVVQRAVASFLAGLPNLSILGGRFGVFALRTEEVALFQR